MIKENKKIYYWLPVVVWWGFIFVLSSIPSAQLPKMPSEDWLFWAHRVAHFVEYAVLGMLLIRAYSYKRARIGVFTILMLAVAILFSGLFDEWHQTFTAGRHAQFIDAAFDTICGMWGMFGFYVWVKWLKGYFQKV